MLLAVGAPHNLRFQTKSTKIYYTESMPQSRLLTLDTAHNLGET